MNEPTPSSVSSSPETPPRRHYGFSLWRFTIGIIIILFGLGLLANQFGWSWSFDVWRLWPVFVILIGASMMTKNHRANTLISVTVGVLITALVAFVIFSNVNFGSRGHSQGDFASPVMPGVTAGNVRLDLGATKVMLSGGGTDLIHGSFDSTHGPVLLDTQLPPADGIQHLRLYQQQEGGWWFGPNRNTVTAQITNTLPVALDIHAGASNLDLDLRQVKATSVALDSGASTILMHLGDQLDASQVTIDAGASSITLVVPKTLGVHLKLDAGLSGKTLPDFREVRKDEFESTNFSTATKKAEMSINAGASSIHVQWE